MRMRLPPKRFFPHEVIYRKKTGISPIGETLFEEEEQVIKNVRFDFSVKFSPRDINGEVQIPNALISMLGKYSGPLPEFFIADQIEFGGKQYTIAHVIPLLADSPEPFGYEIEVV